MRLLGALSGAGRATLAGMPFALADGGQFLDAGHAARAAAHIGGRGRLKTAGAAIGRILGRRRRWRIGRGLARGVM